MEQQNAIVKIESVIPTTKEGIQMFATDIIKQLNDGEISGLELLKTFKMIGKLEEYVKEKMIETALNEADKHPGKDIEMYGVSFQKTETAVAFDYSNCNDSRYVELNKMKTEVAEELKKREKFLQSISGSQVVEDVDMETSEVKNVTLYPPLRTSKSTLKVTIK